MAETYCDKSCAECAQQKENNCLGCKLGPGKVVDGDCELAKCCRVKGHESCQNCGFQCTCSAYRGRENEPENRRKKLLQIKLEKDTLAKRAAVLGKWLWVLFWLCIVAEISGIVCSEPVLQMIPALIVPGAVIGTVIKIAYCAILLKMAPEEERYRTAGICAIAAWLITTVCTLIFGGSGSGLELIFKIPAAIVGLVGEYQEFTANGNVIWEFDQELSDKWNLLWKWYIGCYGVMLGAIVIAFIIPFIAVVVLIGAIIAFLVIHVMRLAYLYQTAKIFREFDRIEK